MNLSQNIYPPFFRFKKPFFEGLGSGATRGNFPGSYPVATSYPASNIINHLAPSYGAPQNQVGSPTRFSCVCLFSFGCVFGPSNRMPPQISPSVCETGQCGRLDLWGWIKLDHFLQNEKNKQDRFSGLTLAKIIKFESPPPALYWVGRRRTKKYVCCKAATLPRSHNITWQANWAPL